MELEALYIRAFAGLKDYSLRVSPGANLIYGPNERGKTTVLNFILAMFYGLGEKRGAQSLRERMQPRDGSAMGGNLWFTHEGTHYELSRDFGLRKRLDQVTLTDLDRNRLVELADYEQPALTLFKLSREVFVNSVFVESNGPSVDTTEQSKREIWDRLADFMVNPEQPITAAQVQQRLEERRLALKSTGGKKGEIPKVCAELEQTRALHRQALALQEEEVLLLNQLDALMQEKEALDEAERRLKIQTIAFEYQRLGEQVARAEERQREHNLLKQEMTPLEALLAPIGETAEERQFLFESLKLGLGTLNSLEDRADKVDKALDLSKARFEAILRVSAAAVGILGLLFLTLGFLLDAPAAQKLLLISGLGALLTALAGFWAEKTIVRGWQQHNKNALELEQLRAALLQKQTELAEKAACLAHVNAQVPVDNIGTVSAVKAFSRDLLQKIHSGEEMQEDLLSLERSLTRWGGLKTQERETIDELHAQRRALELRFSQAARSGETLASALPAAENLEALRQRCTEQALRFAAEQSRLMAKLQGLEAMVKAQGGSGSLSEWIMELETKEREDELILEQKQQAYEGLVLAEQTLKESLLELRQRLLPKLARSAEQSVRLMTRGKYDTIMVTEDLEIMLRDIDAGRYLLPESFSSGTADQIYFAFRLALTDHLAQGQGLPLFLDDLLVNFDDKRAMESLLLLGERGREGQQILLFTCHKRLVKLAQTSAVWQCKTMP